MSNEKETTHLLVTWLIEDEYNSKGYHLYYQVKPFEEEPDTESWGPDEWTYLCHEVVEIQPPNFDMREMMLKSLEGKKKKLMADYARDMASVEDRISKLLALEVDS